MRPKKVSTPHDSNSPEKTRFKTQHVPSPIVKTSGQALANGDLIEILGGSNGAPKLNLLYSDGKVVRIGDKLKLNGTTYLPVEFEESFLGALRLPSRVAASGPANALVADLARAIQNFAGLGNHFSRLTAFYFLMTWFCDCLRTAPRLSVFGPPSRAADQFMRLAAAFCRHSVLLTSASPSGLLSLPFSFGLTILLRLRRVSPPTLQLLDAATKAGQFVPRKGTFICFVPTRPRAIPMPVCTLAHSLTRSKC
jgi:hypothetical protein